MIVHTCVFCHGFFCNYPSPKKIQFHIQVDESDVTGSVSELETAVSGLVDLTKATPKRKAEDKGGKETKNKEKKQKKK